MRTKDLSLVLARIKEFPNYFVSNDGKIYAEHKGVGLFSIALTIGRGGYAYFTRKSNASKKQKTVRVHRIVAEYFCDNKSNKPHVNHINGIKTDNHYKNLEWVTKSENEIHKNRVLEKRNSHKLNKDIAIEIYNEKSGLSHEKLAKKYSISRRLVGMIKSGERWSFYTHAKTQNKV